MWQDFLVFINSQLNELHWAFTWLNVSEVLIIAVAVLAFYKKFIKNTQSEKLVRGIVFLLLAWVFSEVLISVKLYILGMFLKTLVSLVALSLIVIFQPELRRILGYLGQPGVISKTFLKNSLNNEVEKTDVVKEVIESVKYLSKSRIGALIVFQKEICASSYFDVGTKINGDVSMELILTIFHPNTPLHDGAIVIKDGKILSAGVLLPLTEDPKLSWKYGTRHRAAIGMSEVSDSACLVVSEETGDVSVSIEGMLKKYEDLTTLKSDLERILGYDELVKEDKKNVFNFNSFLSFKKNNQSQKANTEK